MEPNPELLELVSWVKSFKLGEAIAEMESNIETAIGYSQRVGEMLAAVWPELLSVNFCSFVEPTG